jgi:hypothetical protein
VKPWTTDIRMGWQLAAGSWQPLPSRRVDHDAMDNHRPVGRPDRERELAAEPSGAAEPIGYGRDRSCAFPEASIPYDFDGATAHPAVGQGR